MLKFFCYSLRHSSSFLLVSASPTGLPLLFSSYLTLALSSPPCTLLHFFFYFNLSGRPGWNCFLSSSVLSNYSGSPNTRFFRRRTSLMSWPDGERCLRPLQSLVVSLVLTLLFSRTGGVLSHLNSSTHRFPRFPPRNLCFLVTPAVFFLAYAARDTAFQFSSYLSRLGRIENPFCRACRHSSQDTSHLILHCPATDSLRRSLFGDYLSLYDLWSRPCGVAQFLVLHGLPPCPHLLEGVG